MDLIVWSRILAPLAIFIFVVYVIISANRLDKKLKQQKAEAKYREKSPIVSQTIDPNTIDEFEESQFAPVKSGKRDVGSSAEELQKVEKKINKKAGKIAARDNASVKNPPIPVDSPTKLPVKPLPITSLLEMSHQTFRNGIILSEILGRPKGLRGR